ncbi:MAG: DHH family phosphoesterase [Spirochaetaceae bacterium]
MDKEKLLDFFELCKTKRSITIQPHDFPDHDAIAAAYGLSILLESRGIPCIIAYNGSISRRELITFIEKFAISLKKAEKLSFTPEDGIIIVDGCKGNKNVTDLAGEEIGIIDHHTFTRPEGVPFVDIRPDYGSCSSIIKEYYDCFGKEISRSAASAFLLGLYTDTAFFTRGVHPADIALLNTCYPIADIAFVTMILRNKIQYQDLHQYRALLNNLVVYDEAGFCFLPEGADPNLLGILCDFILSIQEVKFALIAANNQDGIYLSVRNEHPQLHAAGVVTQIVTKRGGAGGGHYHMAGGSFPPPEEAFDPEAFKDRFFTQINDWKTSTPPAG